MPAHSAAFDTLTYARKLEEAGFTPQQAEVQAHALADIVDERLATKDDIRRLEEVMAANRLAAEHDTALIRKDMEAMRLSLIIWLGGTVVATTIAGVGLIATLIRLGN